MWDAEERVSCQHCKHRGTWKDPCQHRIDHNRVRLYHPSFKSYDAVMPFPCSDFEPAEWCKYIHDHWTGFGDYCIGYTETWGNGKNFYDGLVWVYINGKLWDSIETPIYAIEKKEFVFGHPFDFDTGHLKAVKKLYQKRCKKDKTHPLGIITIIEDIDGITVEEETDVRQDH